MTAAYAISAALPAAPQMLGVVIALAVVLLVFTALALELYPPHVTAVIGVGALLASGVLAVDDFLGVLSNSAPVAIAALFVISGALARTGALEAVTRALRRGAGAAPERTVATLILGAMALSAFVNNTPVAMVLIPVAISLARAVGKTPSQLLIPLSYATILGGICTLFGTSTNLLIDGVARDAGLPAFGVFEITPIGVVAAIVGAAYLAIAGPRLLPARTPTADVANRPSAARFVLETLISGGSPLEGVRLKESALWADNSIRVIDVLRGDASLRRDNMRDVVLQEGDRLVIRTDAADLEQLRKDGMIDVTHGGLEPVKARRSALMEALVGPGSLLIGKQLLRMRVRRRYGVYPVAAHRRSENLAAGFEVTPLDVGDTILLEGAPEDLRRFADDQRLIPLSDPPEPSHRTEKAPHAVAVMLGVVVLASLGVASITALALIGAALLLALRVIEGDEAADSVDTRLLTLIYAMLAIGAALQSTGAVTLIVSALEPGLAALPTFLMLLAIYFMASLLTELVTNNAVAVVLAPIVIELATALGTDARPLLLLIMVGASASFATPIGYQTNTLVYSAGGYRFRDFLVVGAPLNALVGVTATTMVWLLYY